MAFFKKLVKKNPEDPEARFFLGNALFMKLNEMDDEVPEIEMGPIYFAGVSAFSKALELDETHWDARLSRGEVYLYSPSFLGKIDDSVKDFKELIRQQSELGSLEEKHARPYAMMGYAYMKKNQLDKAKEIWNEGLRQFPGNEGILRGLQEADARENRPYLGFSTVSTEKGLLIDEVRDGGPAEKAGLLPMDLLVEFNGVLPAARGDLVNALKGMRPGDRVKIKVRRGGKTRETELTLGISR